MLKNKKLLKEYSTDIIKVYSVDGDFIRKNDDADFYRGGNWLAQAIVPTKEIWVDNTLPKKQQKLVILKNYSQAIQMSKSVNYEDAVYFADKIDDKLSESKIDELIKKEMVKTKKMTITDDSFMNGQIHHQKHHQYNQVNHARNATIVDFNRNEQIRTAR
jgi:hypothetical protein